jgi:SAM-dependent methyltransferase
VTELRPTLCPICDTDALDDEVYPMSFRLEDLDARVFSARRAPDRLHYRMVRCRGCGLLRSNPILPDAQLGALYRSSGFTYGTEARFATETYARQLDRVLPRLPERGALLEIGCGNGLFLDAALARGFRSVRGVEPSGEAVAAAPPHIRPAIRIGLYGRRVVDDQGDDQGFDVVCGFQVLDHAPDPAALLAACWRDLKPGGIALFINHDAGAPSARLLGEKSPIVDVEHTALYDKRTMRRVFEKAGFTVHEVFSVANTYPAAYWAKMMPLPARLKRPLERLLDASGAGRLPVRLYAGNLGIVAQKTKMAGTR